MQQNPAQNYEEGYAPVFFPNAASADSAALLEVAPGAVLHGIDLTLAKTRLIRIRGHVTNGATGKAGNGGQITMMPKQAEGSQMRGGSMGGRVDREGNFEIHNVPPGSYNLIAQLFAEGDHPSMAKTTLDVGSTNIDGVSLVALSGADVNGHVVVENKATTPSVGINVQLNSKESTYMFGNAGAQVKENWSFTLRPVFPGKHTVNVYGMQDNFYVKSMKLGDTDVNDGELDFSEGVTPGELVITISPAAGQMDGTVHNDEGQPAGGATTVLIPSALEKRGVERLYRIVTTDQNGNFSMKGITPGEYKLFAWAQIEWGQYMDPDFLKPYESKGETVKLEENGKETKQLTVIPAVHE